VSFRLPVSTPTAVHPLFPELDSSWHGIQAVAFDGSRLYIAGEFNAIGDKPFRQIAAWDGAHWNGLGTGIDDGLPNTIALHNSMLYMGGEFARVGGVAVNSVARWTGGAWQDVGGGVTRPIEFDPDLGGTFTYEPPANADGTRAGRVYAIAFLDDELVVAGSFTRAGGTPAYNIARWDGTRWHALATTPEDGPMYVSALAVYQGRLVAAGNFSRIGSVSAEGIAQWDGVRWSALGSQRFYDTPDNNQPDSRITSLAVDSSNLYAAGRFRRIDSMSTGAVARWDGRAWHAVGTGAPGTDAPPDTPSGSSLVAVLGANIFVTSPISRKLFRFDGETWHAEIAPLNDSGASSNILALTVNRGLLFVSGDLPDYHDVAVFDGTRWWPPSTPTLSEAISENVHDLGRDLLPVARVVAWPVAILVGWFSLAAVFQFRRRRS
jgi:hypothetical protein